eukprot:COSAG06_NODE_1658_length_8784_cov_4.452850_4_plen_206_part_00
MNSVASLATCLSRRRARLARPRAQVGSSTQRGGGGASAGTLARSEASPAVRQPCQPAHPGRSETHRRPACRVEVALPNEAGGAVVPEQLELVLVVAAAVLMAEDPNEVVPDFVVARRAAGCCAVHAVVVALAVRPIVAAGAGAAVDRIARAGTRCGAGRQSQVAVVAVGGAVIVCSRCGVRAGRLGGGAIASDIARSAVPLLVCC